MRLGHNDGLSVGSKVLGGRIWRRVKRVEGPVRVECLAVSEAWSGWGSRTLGIGICGGMGHWREYWQDKRKAP
jgi:hypothetical protein